MDQLGSTNRIHDSKYLTINNSFLAETLLKQKAGCFDGSLERKMIMSRFFRRHIAQIKEAM